MVPLHPVGPGLLLLLVSCTAAERREPVSFDAAIDDLALCDVVFLGEEHDNTEGHRFHAQMLEALHRLRPTMALSMEMFERDVQGALDQYLVDDLDEKQFLDAVRPWPNYARHYRDLVEFAKSKALPVIAANVPRDLARRVAAEGLSAVEGSPYAARATSAPRDAYWRAFRSAMEEHMGADAPDKLARMYEAQCLKDDTMAESIADFLAREGAADTLVVHVCGKFHSDHGYGTVERLRARGPHLRIAVVGMAVEAAAAGARLETGSAAARYTVAVPPEPPQAKETEPAVARTPPPGEAKAAEPIEEIEEAIDPDARPALGFMPDYDSAGGVGVQMVVEGGPAHTAGIEIGDLIIEVAGHPIEDVQEYMVALGNLRVGETVDVVVMRGEAEKRLKVKVGQRSH
jgi:uncharacterized iron-regulated protein